jgi:hypothetical protein
MILVELFSKEDCHLCKDALAVLRNVQRDIPFSLEERILLPGDPFYESFNQKVPVVLINHVETFHFRVDEGALRRKLLALTP